MPINVSPIIIRNNPPPQEEFVSSSNAPTLTYGLITSYSNIIQTSNVTVTNITTSNVSYNYLSYNAQNLNIFNSTSEPSLTINNTGGNGNIVTIYNTVDISFLIANNGNVGIKTLNPNYALDVNGTINANNLIGSGALLYNVNLN